MEKNGKIREILFYKIIMNGSDLQLSNEVKNFQRHYFLSNPENVSEIQGWYRFFDAWDIKVDPLNKTINIYCRKEHLNYWVTTADSRKAADTTFLWLNDPIVNAICESENNLFNFKTSWELPEKYISKLWWRIAITHFSFYLDKKTWKTYIVMPLETPNFTYWASAKLQWSYVPPFWKWIHIPTILKKIKTKTSDIILNNWKVILDNRGLQLWDWTVKVYMGNWFSKLDNASVWRSPDWSLELITADTIETDDILKDWKANENIEEGYKRAVCLVDLEKLKSIKEWENLEIERLCYDNELIDIKDLPEGYKSMFSKKDWKVFYYFKETPPLKQVRQQINRVLFNTYEYRNKILSALENKVNKKQVNLHARSKEKKQNKEIAEERKKIWEEAEKRFWEKFWLEKVERQEYRMNFGSVINFATKSDLLQNKTLYEILYKIHDKIDYINYLKLKNDWKLNMWDFIEIIELSIDISKILPSLNLEWFIDNNEFKIGDFISYIHPDFEIPLNDWKKIFIEYKKSKKSKDPEQRLYVEMVLLFAKEHNIQSYNIIVWSDYWIEHQDLWMWVHIYSEAYIDGLWIKTKEELEKFLINPDWYKEKEA